MSVRGLVGRARAPVPRRGRGVRVANASSSARLPRSLFDTVADNNVRNAASAPIPPCACASRSPATSAVALRVCDSGAAVAPELAATLLRAPVSSGSGLGIGLYQAARLAETRTGYRLELETNQGGRVCFVLQHEEGQAPWPAPRASSRHGPGSDPGRRTRPRGLGGSGTRLTNSSSRRGSALR